MIEVCVDGAEIQDRKQLHDRLAMELGFPAWYGSNLDALYDCLMDIHEDTSLAILHWGQLRETLGDYGDGLFRVLRRVESENQWFHII